MTIDATVTPAARGRDGFLANARRILGLAWPVTVGQMAVLAYATIDTVVMARLGAGHLAALSVGAAIYASVFVGLMGVVQAVSPLAARHFGAGRPRDAGEQLRQGLWVALLLSLPGCALLVWSAPFLHLTQSAPEQAVLVQSYLRHLAPALPAALVFAAFRGFSSAVSQPRRAMRLQFMGLALKLPLTLVLVAGLPGAFGLMLGDEAVGGAGGAGGLGVAGCGLATAAAMVLQMLLALRALRRDLMFAPFGLQQHIWSRPDAALLRDHLRLGVPMGLSVLVEVTGFTFMALFIARLGPAASAGHQICANVVSLLFMASLGVANACGALVAQAIGAGDRVRARTLGWHGLLVGAGLAALLGGAATLVRSGLVRLYASDDLIVASAVPLLAWVFVFHLADAVQTVAAFVLRAWQVALWPLLVYAATVWGLGLGGGYALAFGALLPGQGLEGAAGFWGAASLGLCVTGVALIVLLRRLSAPALPG